MEPEGRMRSESSSESGVAKSQDLISTRKKIVGVVLVASILIGAFFVTMFGSGFTLSSNKKEGTEPLSEKYLEGYTALMNLESQKAVSFFTEALQNADTTEAEAIASLRLGMASFDSGDTEYGIVLLKKTATEEKYPKLIRAMAINALMERFANDRRQTIGNLIFGTGSPWTSFNAGYKASYPEYVNQNQAILAALGYGDTLFQTPFVYFWSSNVMSYGAEGDSFAAGRENFFLQKAIEYAFNGNGIYYRGDWKKYALPSEEVMASLLRAIAVGRLYALIPPGVEVRGAPTLESATQIYMETIKLADEISHTDKSSLALAALARFHFINFLLQDAKKETLTDSEKQYIAGIGTNIEAFGKPEATKYFGFLRQQRLIDDKVNPLFLTARYLAKEDVWFRGFLADHFGWEKINF